MSLADEFKDLIRSRERDVSGESGQISHKGNNYPCNASSFSRMKTWGDSIGGGMIDYNLSVTIRLDIIAAEAVAENDTILHRGKSARVRKITEDGTGAFIRLLCVYEKGA